MSEFYCGYCGGDVIFSDENAQHEHANSGERITNITPGDFVSAQHNQQGSRVIAADVQRSDERDLDHEYIDRSSIGDDAIGLESIILDAAGNLPCGCHGSQREHTCGVDPEAEMRAEGGYDI